jgi:hypothetical protein
VAGFIWSLAMHRVLATICAEHVHAADRESLRAWSCCMSSALRCATLQHWPCSDWMWFLCSLECGQASCMVACMQDCLKNCDLWTRPVHLLLTAGQTWAERSRTPEKGRQERATCGNRLLPFSLAACLAAQALVGSSTRQGRCIAHLFLALGVQGFNSFLQ